MTPAQLAYIRGLRMAAHAAAFMARDARNSGNLPEYSVKAQHAAILYEDARIACGDQGALLDRTERILEHEYLLERDRERELDSARSGLESEALEAAAAAINARRRK